MHIINRRALAHALLAASAAALTANAADLPAQAAARPASAAVAASSPLPTGPTGSPTEKRVIEDDKVRIEETRLRGQIQSVTVHSKLPGVRDYEVIMPPLGKDPSQDKGAAGKRTWSLFDF